MSKLHVKNICAFVHHRLLGKHQQRSASQKGEKLKRERSKGWHSNEASKGTPITFSHWLDGQLVFF